jgi:phosphomannomutase
MIDDDRGKIGHAERVALHLGLVQKFGRDDDRGRAAQAFETDSVMRTARRAGASIADRGQDDVVVGRDPRE